MRKKLALTTTVFILCIAVAATARAMIGIVKADPTTISIDPASYQVSEPGLTFKLNITITDTPNIVQWMVRIQYDPNVLNVTDTEEGSFLKNYAGGTTMYLVKPLQNGKIPEMTCITLESGEGPSGSGVLATITFKALAPGTSAVDIYESDLLKSDKSHPSHTVVDGAVTVVPEFPGSMILPLFLGTTAVIVIMVTVARSRRHRGYIDVPSNKII